MLRRAEGHLVARYLAVELPGTVSEGTET